MSSQKCDKDESYTVSTGRYCIADELIGSGKTELRSCGGSDPMAIYENIDSNGEVYYTAHCYSCCQTFGKDYFAESSLASEFGIDNGVVVDRKVLPKIEKASPLTKDEVRSLIRDLGYKSGDYRGIKDEYSQFFGHLTKLDKNGQVLARYYPETTKESNWPTGYKIRIHPKRFNKIGVTGISSELSGQVKFRDYKSHRDVLLVGGEEDKVAAFQMLRDNQIKKGQSDYAPVAVVSPTTGEGSAAKQIRAQYEWLCGFENIILGLDSDECGIAAMEEIAQILPKDKIKVAYWTGKDPNKMLQDGQEKQFISDFYKAKPLDSSGIILSGELDEAIFEELLLEKIPLPPFMSELQRLMAGGIPLGVIVNIGSASGSGKTSFVNEMIYYWLFNSPHMVGVVSLELNKGQYGLAMLSRHAGKKIQLIENPAEAVALLKSDHYVDLRRTLWKDEYGKDRFAVLDERDGSIKQLQNQCEKLINKYGCKLIILDPIQDILDGSTNEEQSVFMRWMKNVVKRGVTFVNINHVRKSGSGDKANSAGKDLVEEDFQGSSSIFKSGAANLLFMRDKYEDDPVMKNVSKAVASKIRWTGHTGYCGSWYYDIDTHTIHDFKTYFTQNPDKLPAHVDINDPHAKPKKESNTRVQGSIKPIKQDDGGIF